MAENDIELSVGIKFDEAQFVNEYQSKLNKLSKATQTQIQGAMDEMSGPAAKQWGTLPFAGMHDPNSGNVIATQAFLSSLSRDLQGAGYSGTAYESALINATYRSSMADPMQRYHRMLAIGLTQQADLTHPDTALGKTIETDYALMSQPWSRDFIKTTNYRGQKRSYVDFAGMREYAVGAGLGRWIDEDGGNTADNFEFINDELEKIEDKSDKTKKSFNSWHNTLKGVLGTLTAIAAVTVKAFEVAYKSSEAHTIQAGGALDKRRAFIGMSALDELKTKVASKSVGLGEDAIKNEIYSMSGNIEQYKLLGQGDALPSALLGIFDNLMSAEDPYSVYTQSADELYKQLKGADAQTRRRWLMLMNKAGLGSMSSLVGQFLSNPDYAKQYGTPSALFNLKSNPYYGVYGEAETMLPQITKLNESLKASYNQMYTDWEKAFGIPFKTWWDSTMQNKVVPWFERILEIVAPRQSVTDEEFDKSWKKVVKSQIKANRPKKITEQDVATGAWSLAAGKAVAIGDEYWHSFDASNIADSYIKGYADKAAVRRLKGDYSEGTYAYKPSEFLEGLKVLAKEKAYSDGALDNADADKMQSRAALALDWLKETGFESQLKGGVNTTTSYALIKVLKEYLATPNMQEGRQTLEAYLTETYLKTAGWNDVIAPFLKANAGYLRENPERLQEIKITLFNEYGAQIQARVDDIVYGDSKSTNR